MRGATDLRDGYVPEEVISTHAPLAGRDVMILVTLPNGADFNPRAPCGARPSSVFPSGAYTNFNPRAPCGARLGYLTREQTHDEFQPTRPLRGATKGLSAQVKELKISTHAPLAGRDSRSKTSRA